MTRIIGMDGKNRFPDATYGNPKTKVVSPKADSRGTPGIIARG